MRTTKILSTLAAALLLGACASSSVERTPSLEAQVAAIRAASASGDHERATRQADALLARADEGGAQGQLDRFDAAVLAAEAHVRAAEAAPFLTEPAARGERKPSLAAHLIAATRYLALARAAAPRAATLGGREADRIAELAPGLDLMELAVHARLGLEPSARAFLELAPELHDPAACARAVERHGIGGSSAWVYAALFDFVRARDERAAYRFAVLAIDRAVDPRADFEPRRVAELERWITRESSLEFHCPRCDLEVTPALHACPNDRTPNLDFVARKRL